MRWEKRKQENPPEKERQNERVNEGTQHKISFTFYEVKIRIAILSKNIKSFGGVALSRPGVFLPVTVSGDWLVLEAPHHFEVKLGERFKARRRIIRWVFSWLSWQTGFRSLVTRAYVNVALLSRLILILLSANQCSAWMNFN